jgi:hypothetical protein
MQDDFHLNYCHFTGENLLKFQQRASGVISATVGHTALISEQRTPIHTYTHTPWPESASEPYRQSDRPLSEKLVPTFADRGSHVVSVTDSYGRP